jgi:hypothetical protein
MATASAAKIVEPNQTVTAMTGHSQAGQVDVAVEAAEQQHDHDGRHGGGQRDEDLGDHVGVGRQRGEPELADPAFLLLLRDPLRVAVQRAAERAEVAIEIM